MDNDTVKQLELQFKEWKPMAGYEEHYQISRSGMVIRTSKARGAKVGKILKVWVSSTGYPNITVQVNKEKHNLALHRMLMLTFVDNPENKPEINHIDGNRENYNLSNLEWCTTSENLIHSYKVLGRKPLVLLGEKANCAKLTTAEVLEIRTLYNGKEHNFSSLGRRYGVEHNTIAAIIKRKSWIHI